MALTEEDTLQTENTRKTNIKKVFIDLSTLAADGKSDGWFGSPIVVEKMAKRLIPQKEQIGRTHIIVNGIVLIQNETSELLLTQDGVMLNSYKSNNRSETANYSIPIISRRGSVNQFSWVVAPFVEHILFDGEGLLSRSEEKTMNIIQQSIYSFKEELDVALSQAEAA